MHGEDCYQLRPYAGIRHARMDRVDSTVSARSDILHYAVNRIKRIFTGCAPDNGRETGKLEMYIYSTMNQMNAPIITSSVE